MVRLFFINRKSLVASRWSLVREKKTSRGSLVSGDDVTKD